MSCCMDHDPGSNYGLWHRRGWEDDLEFSHVFGIDKGLRGFGGLSLNFEYILIMDCARYPSCHILFYIYVFMKLRA
jgi:hypothetical protein